MMSKGMVTGLRLVAPNVIEIEFTAVDVDNGGRLKRDSGGRVTVDFPQYLESAVRIGSAVTFGDTGIDVPGIVIDGKARLAPVLRLQAVAP